MGMPHKRGMVFCFMKRVTVRNDLWLNILFFVLGSGPFYFAK